MNLGENIRKHRKSRGWTQEELAERSGVSQANISAIERRKSGRSNHAPALAKAFGVSLEELHGIAVNTDGSVQEEPAIYNVQPGPEVQGLVPLISWAQAGDWQETEDPFEPGDAEMWLPCPVKHGPYTYALRVSGDSMLPRFPDGELIFIDPDRHPEHRQFVIVRRTETDKTTFKQFMRSEDGSAWLKPLNPNWPELPIPCDENVVLKGVVIFRGAPV